jgi:hypothetical protein
MTNGAQLSALRRRCNQILDCVPIDHEGRATFQSTLYKLLISAAYTDPQMFSVRWERLVKEVSRYVGPVVENHWSQAVSAVLQHRSNPDPTRDWFRDDTTPAPMDLSSNSSPVTSSSASA